jgi:rhodanese-related sulfurtransferase
MGQHTQEVNMRTTTRLLLVLCLTLVACASVPSGTTERFTAFDAMELWEKDEVLLLDVRSELERRKGAPQKRVASVQYGPDRWNGTVDDTETSRFIEAVRRINPDGKPIAILCQYGVRAEAAHRVLAQNGITARTIADGYLGNQNGPGWKSLE